MQNMTRQSHGSTKQFVVGNFTARQTPAVLAGSTRDAVRGPALSRCAYGEMEKVRPWCGQPSDRGRLRNRTEQISLLEAAIRVGYIFLRSNAAVTKVSATSPYDLDL